MPAREGGCDTDERIKVLVVDDDIIFRQRLGRLLEASEEIRIVGEAANGEEAIAKIRQTWPNVILMDIKTPEVDGSKSIRIIRRRFPGLGIIALSMYENAGCLLEAINAGAKGYVHKAVSADILVATIRRVHKPPAHLTAEGAKIQS